METPAGSDRPASMEVAASDLPSRGRQRAFEFALNKQKEMRAKEADEEEVKLRTSEALAEALYRSITDYALERLHGHVSGHRSGDLSGSSRRSEMTTMELDED